MTPTDPTEELIEWLRTQEYTDVRLLPDGSIACLGHLMYTTSIVLGADRWGWAKRFCYTDPTVAASVFAELKSEDDEPTGWIARR